MNTLSEGIVKTHEAGKGVCDLKVADAVWVGTALLHEKYPKHERFTTDEIVDFVVQQRLTKGAYKSIWQHVNQHCVANRKPQPNRVCMLFALGHGDRRLFRPGDRRDEGRAGAPTHPEWNDLPQQYQYLRHWYEEWVRAAEGTASDPLLDLVGTGTAIWKNEHADEYVARLRENWGESR